MRLVLSLSTAPALLAVERAIAEIRAARPVVIDGGDSSALVIGIEDLDAAQCVRIEALAGGQAHLVLPPARLRRLGRERRQAGRVALPAVDLARIETLAWRVEEARLGSRPRRRCWTRSSPGCPSGPRSG